jgi:hypothetical protein
MSKEKELGAQKVEKGRLSCDSDAPQVGSARSDSTSFVKVNRPKTNRRKTRLYCIYLKQTTFLPYIVLQLSSMYNFCYM